MPGIWALGLVTGQLKQKKSLFWKILLPCVFYVPNAVCDLAPIWKFLAFNSAHRFLHFNVSQCLCLIVLKCSQWFIALWIPNLYGVWMIVSVLVMLQRAIMDRVVSPLLTAVKQSDTTLDRSTYSCVKCNTDTSSKFTMVKRVPNKINKKELKYFEVFL